MAISRAFVLYHLRIICSTLFAQTRNIHVRANDGRIIGSVLGGLHQARVKGRNAITEEDNPSLMFIVIAGSVATSPAVRRWASGAWTN